ncbi:N-methylhydantoinase B [Paenibacillus sp. UNCCL117]|uniref:hydantoinase B/oxoprolinase family protein n=1 Tax=unclassified Paenibacillus TaxID=185978 RepID=UPI0008872C3B|nr:MULTISPECIES: hydantoinase B/oxoprolinase family protein [unclassified Paenibacillus]SDD96188.1 N-methylhydantoinase B [Paenibacillus sp. cl123]SFW56444.1 N-methylhydantoinase B [Paenibacillus sp. UNCCL117]
MSGKVDAITIEVMKNAFHTIAEEMGVALIKTALSTNIKDRMDCSTAIYTKEGKLVAQAEHIPLHLGLMPSVVGEVLKIYKPDELKEGDAILINDPYISGSHLPDIFMISPVFHQGRLVALTANIAHHIDVGGMTPGSCSVKTTEIFQEGLRLPAIRVRKAGVMDEEVLRLLTKNSRTGKEMLGDIYAQLAANKIGETRLKELFERYSPDFTEACMNELMNYSERRLRAAIRKVPDGTYAFEDYLEGDGLTDDLIKIAVQVSVKDDEIHVSFDGTAPQARGSINSTIGVTSACAYYAVKALLDPEVPPNDGAYRPVHVHAQEGTIVNAKFPAAVSNANGNTSQRITDAILGALAPVLPEAAIAACSGSMNGLNFGGFNEETGEYFSYIETCGGGQGAVLGLDGMDGVHTHMTNTRNTPTEVIEQSYPLLVKKYSFVESGGGYGKYRGGVGITREIISEADDVIVTITSERQQTRPWGLFGGKEGAASECIHIEASGKVTNLPPKATLTIQRGDTVIIRTPGGGGYRNPLERDPDSVRQDVRFGYVKPDDALREYGVAFVPGTGEVDELQTAELRRSMAAGG